MNIKKDNNDNNNNITTLREWSDSLVGMAWGQPQNACWMPVLMGRVPKPATGQLRTATSYLTKWAQPACKPGLCQTMERSPKKCPCLSGRLSTWCGDGKDRACTRPFKQPDILWMAGVTCGALLPDVQMTCLSALLLSALAHYLFPLSDHSLRVC